MRARPSTGGCASNGGGQQSGVRTAKPAAACTQHFPPFSSPAPPTTAPSSSYTRSHAFTHAQTHARLHARTPHCRSRVPLADRPPVHRRRVHNGRRRCSGITLLHHPIPRSPPTDITAARSPFVGTPLPLLPRSFSISLSRQCAVCDFQSSVSALAHLARQRLSPIVRRHDIRGRISVLIPCACLHKAIVARHNRRHTVKTRRNRTNISAAHRSENRRRLVPSSLCLSIMAAAAVAAATTAAAAISAAAALTRRAVNDAVVVVRGHRCRHDVPALTLVTPRLLHQ
ncbi:hypothetical protein ACI65C_005926 [Semiaphis heraclei]